MATLFRAYTTVHLSEPVPHHAFVSQWASGPDDTQHAMRALTVKQRRKLLCLTAAAGDVSNLAVAVSSADILLCKDVFDAAAAAGQLDVCIWLVDQGLDDVFEDAAGQAAEAGHLHVCNWLLARGYDVLPACLSGAARAGRTDLISELMPRLPADDRAVLLECLVDVAAGCDLAALQRLHSEWPAAAGQPGALAALSYHGRDFDDYWINALTAAAGSLTPDWRDKVVWLEALGYEKTSTACRAEAMRPDAVERLTWLQQRGYGADSYTLWHATKAGNEAAVQYLLAEGIRPYPDRYDAALEAARGGHLSMLRAFRAVECLADPRGVLCEAAYAGHLDIVAWVVEEVWPEAPQDGWVLGLAAQSGNLELLAWMRARGWRWQANAFAQAASGGSVASVEWLAEHGYAMPEDGSPYMMAVCVDDLLMLRCLRRLGCPWGEHGDIFARVAGSSWPARLHVVLLRCLLDFGCPVDWEMAEQAARRNRRSAVLEWIAGQRG